ncbi:MAG: hypothetical protein O2890_06865 [Cyanobacteria bacterium]|nr:hypothetical protein [Cyanobacteriota bacterium]MDA0866126.1 hypothetical protein [Cyanobacteriota bacterium]
MQYAYYVWGLAREKSAQIGQLVDAQQGWWGEHDLLRCPVCEDRVFFKEGFERTSHFSHYDNKTSKCCALRVEQALGGGGTFHKWFQSKGQSREEMGQWVWGRIEKVAHALGVDAAEPLERYEVIALNEEIYEAEKLYGYWNKSKDSAGLPCPMVIHKWARKYSSTGGVIDYGSTSWLDYVRLSKWAKQYSHNYQLIERLGKSVKGAADWGRQINIAYSLYSYIGLPHNQEILLSKVMTASFEIALDVVFPGDRHQLAPPGMRIPVLCSEVFHPGVIRQLTLAIAQLLLLGVDWYREYLIAIHANQTNSE